MFKRLRDELVGYRAARITAEALVWHHGVEGVRRALDAAERPNESKEAHRQAVRVARLAGHSYQLFKGADLEERATILEVWSKRKGSLIRLDWTDGLPPVAEWRGSLLA